MHPRTLENTVLNVHKKDKDNESDNNLLDITFNIKHNGSLNSKERPKEKDLCVLWSLI